MSVETLRVSAKELAIVKDILRRVIPEREVWAFGSRVTGRTKKYSDLDLVIIGDDPLPLGVMGELAEAFTESDLPYKVDLVDWATTSERFRRIIEASHVRLLADARNQSGTRHRQIEPQKPISAKGKPTQLGWLRRFGSALTLFSAAAGLLGWWSLRPDIRVTPDESEDPTKAFQQTFRVENASLYTVSNVQSGCAMIEVRDEQGSGVQGLTILNGPTDEDGGYVDYLSHEGLTSFRCSLDFDNELKDMKIGVTVFYDLPLHLSRLCNMAVYVGHHTAQGSYIWFPKGSQDCSWKNPK